MKELKSQKEFLDRILIIIIKEMNSNTHLIPPVIRIFMAILEAQYNKVKRINPKEQKKKKWTSFNEFMGKIIG